MADEIGVKVTNLKIVERKLSDVESFETSPTEFRLYEMIE